MKKASRAKTISEKLSNLERIHSKIVSFSQIKENGNGSNQIQIEEFRKFINNLETLVECMSQDISGKHVRKYVHAIKQVHSHAIYAKVLLDRDLFNSCCCLHGSFIKFKKRMGKRFTRGCEIDYQNVCLPLLLIELEKKNIRDN